MTLIERGKSALAAQIQPVLRNYGCALTPATERSVIDGFREGVVQGRGEAAVEPAAQLNLGRLASGIAVGSKVYISRWTCRTRIQGSDGISVGQKFLLLASPLDAKVSRVHDQRARQVALNDHIPVLRVTNAEIRIDGESIRRDGFRGDEAVGQGEWIVGAVLHAQARGG